MLIALRPEAEQELLDSQAWYESKALGLGFEFARAADVAVASAYRLLKLNQRKIQTHTHAETRRTRRKPNQKH